MIFSNKSALLFYDIKIWESNILRRKNIKLNLAPLKNIFVSYAFVDQSVLFSIFP